MWLALRFEHWALDCRTGIDATDTRLVVDTVDQRQRVIAACPTALAAGVRLGMGLADARMHLNDVIVHERHHAGETMGLDRLSGWAWGYSSQIHRAIAGPEIECTRLVMEIGASLKLFGGRGPMLERIKTDLDTMGHRYQAGVGDTPQAALAFARARRRARRLADLPIGCLDLAPDTVTTLSASGIHQSGDLFALPPAVLVRRFGQSLLYALDRLSGHRPHGLPLYTLPSRYRTHHELVGAVDNTQGLVFVLRRIFEALAVFLRGADSAIQTLRLVLVHEREPATRLVLRLAAPSHDARHLEQIAQERLGRITLTAPVLAIALVSDRLRRAEHGQPDFWHGARQHDSRRWPAMLDRLRARLGHEAVLWLDAPDDHRPSQASALRDMPTAPTPPSCAETGLRPLWLIEPPEPLAAEDICHWLAGPERIESGWWGQGQRRDYYRVLDNRDRLAWVFRDLSERPAERSDRVFMYYLNGLFG